MRNKRNMAMASIFPELTDIHKQADGTVILDGELVVVAQGKPDFEKLQRRVMMADPFKIRLAANANQAIFVAFDILYLNGRILFDTPLTLRKQLLTDAIVENERLAVSRVTMEQGVALYNYAEGLDLEGIVAKRNGSLYHPGKRTKDWIKIKYMQEEDFVAAGYIPKESNVVSLVLGQAKGKSLEYMGHVTLGVSGELVGKLNTSPNCPFEQIPPGNEKAIWFNYMPMCTVKYMKRTSAGSMRQPVFKGFRL